MTTTFNWCVVAEDLSVCDRFATAEEAVERLAEYGTGFYVGYVDEPVPPCDFNHYHTPDPDDPHRAELVTHPAQWWVQDVHNEWTPVCNDCLPDFWGGGDREGQPFEVYPIDNVPEGPKRLKKMENR